MSTRQSAPLGPLLRQADRRSFMVQAAVALAAARRAGAQPLTRAIFRVGYVRPSSGPAPSTRAFQRALADLGYIEGRNLVIEYYWMAGRESEYPAVMKALSGKVNLVVVYGDIGVNAAEGTAVTTPVVFVNADESMVLGVVQSLQRPGGNMTGIVNAQSELIPKRLAILEQALPGVLRFAVLIDPAAATSSSDLERLDTAAKALGIIVRRFEVSTPEALDGVVSQITRDGFGAIIIGGHPWLSASRALLVATIAKYRLPAMFPCARFVEGGGLLSYSSSQMDLAARAATYVGRILGGEKPGNLSVERPSKSELVINAGTAKALGLTIPPALLMQADRVIE
jgi:putative ABC transport system substrate-binding protein